MAELAVGVLTDRILDAFIQERNLLNGVENQLEWIEKELRLMHASSLQQDSSAWAEEACNLVAEVDDIINIFLNKSARKRRNPSSLFHRLFLRHQFAMKLEQIKAKIRRVSRTRTRQEGMLIAATSSSSGQLLGNQPFEASIRVSCVINEADVVLSQNLLFQDGLTRLVEDLLDEFLRLQGMLKNVQEKGEFDERTNAWLDEVLEVSDNAKEVFESFRREREELLLRIFNMASLIRSDLRFGRAINLISNALYNLYERRWRYGIGDHSELSKRPNSINLKKSVMNFTIYPLVLMSNPLGMVLFSFSEIGLFQLGELLGKEIALWRPVENQLKSISRDFKLMQALINDVQGKEGLDQRVQVWLDEIKDIKRHAGSLLDFAHHNPDQDTPRGIIKSTFARPKVWKKIKQINSRIHEVSKRKWTYDIGKIEGNSKNSPSHLQEGESSSTEVPSTTWNAEESIKWELKLMKALFADVAPIKDQDERVKLWVGVMQSVAKDARILVDKYGTRKERRGIFRNLFIEIKMSKLIKKIHTGLHDISQIKSTYAIGGIEGRRGQEYADETQHEILPAVSAISETPTTFTAISTFAPNRIAVLYPNLILTTYLNLDVRLDRELIKREQRLMAALFTDVGDQERLESTQKDWVEALRAVADDMNSAIDMHNIAMTGWNIFQRLAAADKIRFVACKIRDLPQRVPYGMKHIKGSGQPNKNTVGSQHQTTTPSFGLEEPDVNLYDDLQAVKAQLLVPNEHHHINFIVGMEGIGKTALAKLIYEDGDVKDRFPHREFVSRPSYENTTALVNKIKQLMGIQEQEGEVIDANTCLIVLDDVRAIGEWDKLKNEFLSRFNGIRILVTTRSLGVANYADPPSVSHKLHLLSDDDSWFLFKKSLTIPRGLEEQDIRTEVLIPCGGLPKTIIEVREQFSQVEPTPEAWLGLFKTLRLNQEPWQEAKKIIEGNFPLSSRRCLFIIAQFPTKIEIPVRRLIALWIAEGVVRQRRGDPGNSFKDSPESIAKRYLTELIDRNMVQVTKKKLNGEVKRCRLPHPLQDLRTSKSSHLVDYYDLKDPIFKHVHEGNENISNSSLSCYNDVISFTSFDTREGFTPGEELGKFLNICISSRCFKLLRVLDLEHVFRPELPKAIGKLTRLRYLGLRWTYLEILPSFISKLLNLQILDVKHTSISTLPRSIWKMHQLRHLYLNESYRCRLASPRSRQTITDLQTLWGVFIDEESPVKNGLNRLLNLKRLGLTSHLMVSQHQYAMVSQLEAVADWVKKMKQLQFLRLKSLDESNHPWYLPLKPLLGHTSLSSIYMLGRIKNKFIVSGLPRGITELTLSGSGLKKDPMRTLKDLPSLKILTLLGNSFIGRHMLCSSGGFLQLRVLKLWKLMHLEEWKLRKGALPNLIDLEIRSCVKLKVLPNGLSFLSTLPGLKLSDMPKDFIDTIKVNQIHQWDISDTSETSAILTSKIPKKFTDVKVDASKSGYLTTFEVPLSAQKSNSYNASNSVQEENVNQTRSMKPENYSSSFPSKLWPHMNELKNVKADGNCGFRAIAVLMGMEEDSWLQVRKDLIRELNAHRVYYETVYNGKEEVDELLHRLSWTKSPAHGEHWMTLPDMGHLVASSYNVVLVLISTRMCMTFLPLRSEPLIDPHNVIVIGHVNDDHFVKVCMSSNSPLPPISEKWSRYRHPCAKGWQTPYIDRIKDFSELVGKNIVTREDFENEDEEMGNEEEDADNDDEIRKKVGNEDEETARNENKDDYYENGAVPKEFSKDTMIPNTRYS